MANKNAVKNETVNNAIEEKEEKNMADQTKEKAPVKKEEKPEEPGTAVSTNVEKPDEGEKETLGAKIKRKGKKIALIAGGVAAGIGALFVAKKIGEAKGFDKACDAFAAAGGDPYDPESGIPEPDDIPEVDMSEIPDVDVSDI